MVKKHLSGKRTSRPDVATANRHSLIANVKHNWFIYLFLVVMTLAVYSRVTGFEFVTYDDDLYVVNNSHVHAGLSARTIGWAFTGNYSANWMPLTWMSLMLDHDASRGAVPSDQAAREDPRAYHRTNVILHVLNTLLLFIVLTAATGKRWRSAAVAALFAVHPLHVESVAWVAERKDVLSTLFLMLALWAYTWYAAKPGKWRYLSVPLLFVLGLMSKSMLVTLPLVLLLLDFWPLKRVAGWTGDKNGIGRTWGRLIVEKLPLLALSGAAGLVTLATQKHAHAMCDLTVFPLGVRLANAAVSYVLYICKMIWPANLACIYPHPGATIPAWQVIGSAVLLGVITLASILAARRRPWLTVGWLWYAVTLLPVIGIVQVGFQAMADRYSYITLVGIFVIVVWGVSELIPAGKPRIPLLATLAAAVIAPLSVQAYRQTGYWRDTDKLFSHAIAATPNNDIANEYLGSCLVQEGRIDEAIACYDEALRISPNEATFHSNLGLAYMQQGDFREACEQLLEAVRLDPGEADLRNRLGIAYVQRGRTDRAREAFLAALTMDPKSPTTMYNLAGVAMHDGKPDLAVRYLTKAHKIAPDDETINQALQSVEADMDRSKPPLRR